jgi:ribosome biogenesis ATPase
MKTAPDLDFGLLAKMTPGFVGADLQALATTAGVVTVRRISKIDEIARQLDDKMDTDQPPQSTPQLPSLSITVVEAWISQTRKNPPPPMTADEEQSIYITQEDFLAALPRIQPSAKREGFATVPDVTWDNIGALSELRRALQLAIVEQIQDPERYSSVGITAPSGVLLWGPPGCGKTLLAKAVANQSRANFISVKGPELLNKVGCTYLLLGK